MAQIKKRKSVKKMKVSLKILIKFYYSSLFNDSFCRKDLSTFLLDSVIHCCHYKGTSVTEFTCSHTQEVIQTANYTIHH